MTSLAVRNRKNAAKSTGPRTPSGKTVAARNALKHGMRAVAPVVPGLERQKDWDAHRDAVLRAIEPEGGVETALAERVATVLWRLQRVVRYETDMIAVGYARAEEDFAESRRALASVEDLLGGEDVSPSDVRVAADIATSARRSLERLLAGWEADVTIDRDNARAVFSALGRAAQELAADEDELDPEQLTYDGIPDEIAIEDFAGWTLPIVLGVLCTLAEAVSVPPDTLIRRAIDCSQSEERRATMKRRNMERDLDGLRRSRTLPRADILERVARYEAHLDRLLQRTLHEIQRLQAMRAGTEILPPAAVDVIVDGTT